MNAQSPPRPLPDVLAPGLDIVSVGLNPSPISVERGYCFANPRNRFWTALRRSGLVDPDLEPGPGVMERLARECGIGFTDVVGRPTPGAGALRVADFVRDAPALEEKLERFRPTLVWFHGRVAWHGFLRGTGHRPPRAASWGEQAARAGGRPVFVTPNPSPANAAFSLPDLIGWYRRVGEFAARQGARRLARTIHESGGCSLAH